MKPVLNTRRAEASDAPAVHAVANALRAGELTEASGAGGFLVHVPSAREYAVRIAVASHFYVARTNGEIAGFLLSADAASLNVMRRGMPGEDAVVDHVLSLSVNIPTYGCSLQSMQECRLPYPATRCPLALSTMRVHRPSTRPLRKLHNKIRIASSISNVWLFFPRNIDR